MADPRDRYPENASGAFYVDTQCIDCDLCRQIAPDSFKAAPDGGYSIVYMQPVTDEQIALAEEALDHCPVDAIGRET